ncbi:MAG: inositol 2-dehydrogenase [Candidatus Omnitrophota bacterium]|nr:MAG: inositol 2-dehydrogenase [Candidatus Omnitrophota bacterium]
MNIGLIGTGRIGVLHAEHLAYRIPNARLVALADVNRAAAEACAAKLNVKQVYDSIDPILSDQGIDAVVICSSTDTHSRLIEEAANAKKHIFCEKPIDYDLKRIDKALQTVAEAKVKLQIGFNRRFDPNFFEVRKKVAEGKIGKPHLLHITSRDPAPPPIAYIKVSGGIFLDMTIHDFDMARYLVGSEVESVYATGGVLIDPEIGKAGDVDTAVIILHFADGAIGVIENSRQAVYGYDQRVEVFGSEGMVLAENNAPNRTLLSNREGVHAPLPLYFFLERYTDSFIAEMKTFVDAVIHDKPCPVTGDDARVPVVMGLAAKRSLQEQRKVNLSEIS